MTPSAGIRSILLVLFLTSTILANDPPKVQSIHDNWLSKIFEEGLKYPRDARKVRSITDAIKAHPKADVFKSRDNLGPAVEKGVQAAKDMEVPDRGGAPTPAQAGALRLCKELKLDYPPPDKSPGK